MFTLFQTSLKSKVLVFFCSFRIMRSNELTMLICLFCCFRTKWQPQWFSPERKRGVTKVDILSKVLNKSGFHGVPALWSPLHLHRLRTLRQILPVVREVHKRHRAHLHGVRSCGLCAMFEVWSSQFQLIYTSTCFTSGTCDKFSLKNFKFVI